MKLILSTILFVLFSTSSCSSRKQVNTVTQENKTEELKMNKEIKEVKFGNGGGFTGAVTEYLIKTNGDVYMMDAESNQPTTKVKTLSETDIKGIQKKVKELPKEIWSFNHPYNMYSFVEVEGKRAVFGDPGYPVPKELGELYDYLQELINKKG
ncbi:MAG: hypothetical protein ABI315_06715 [Bacteroidia bacterium]